MTSIYLRVFNVHVTEPLNHSLKHTFFFLTWDRQLEKEEKRRKKRKDFTSLHLNHFFRTIGILRAAPLDWDERINQHHSACGTLFSRTIMSGHGGARKGSGRRPEWMQDQRTSHGGTAQLSTKRANDDASKSRLTVAQAREKQEEDKAKAARAQEAKTRAEERQVQILEARRQKKEVDLVEAQRRLDVLKEVAARV